MRSDRSSKADAFDDRAAPRPQRQKKGRKPTRAETQERAEYAAGLLARCGYKSEIKRLLKARYGVGHHTCEAYLRRARGLLRARGELGGEDRRASSLAFWESVVRSAAASLCEKMAAQRRLDFIAGVHGAAPRVAAAGSGPGGTYRGAPRDDRARGLLCELEGRAAGPVARRARG